MNIKFNKQIVNILNSMMNFLDFWNSRDTLKTIIRLIIISSLISHFCAFISSIAIIYLQTKRALTHRIGEQKILIFYI